MSRVESAVSEPSVDSLLREATSTAFEAIGFEGTARYELVRPLGRGGFGSVYEVNDRGLPGGSAIALKLLRRPHADRLARFKREFRDLAELRHPNLVQLYELVATDATVFFTMELVRGQSPISFVKRCPLRAREVVRQLVEGLLALHADGRLHRDVKPSNILVEPDGRVVLLDFGLASEIGGGDDDVAGTPLYMSPEQGARAALTEASDWYAVGLVLFEALTGRPPFIGQHAELARQRQSTDAPRASTLVPDVPADLDDLCAALLARDPAARPSGAEILTRVGAPSQAPVRARELFVGREAELATLARGFDAAVHGRRTVVLARGPSGIGKSALLRHFLDGVRRRRPDTMILAGRCFELESVPYKALDAIVDELAHRLRPLPAEEVAMLVPLHADALATLFPVLRQVPTVAEAYAVKARTPGDPSEVRGRALSALRTLFARLATRSPVIVCVDDLQWGDADSAALFAELVREPDAPAVFWVAGYREEEAVTSPFLSRLTQLRATALAGVPIEELQLGALDSVEAEQLAAAVLAETPGVDASRARAIAVDSQGSPFFVHELARGGRGVQRLDGILQERLAQLDVAALRILETVAVAARPLELEAMVAAANPGGDVRDALAELRALRLIRARDASHDKLVECYHDRIREAVVRSIAPGALRDVHLALAAALERGALHDAAQIGWHLAEGGDHARAFARFTLAAERAASALAFEDAAHLYRRALDLAPHVTGMETSVIELAYADALSAAGRGREAARVWLAVVDRVPQELSIDLRRRAAEELLLIGQVAQGYAVLTDLLSDLGLAFPRSTVGAVARIVSGRIGLTVSRHRVARVRTPPSPRELLRIDTLGGLAGAMFQLDPLIGYAFQTQHLQLALRSGDRHRAAAALWLEAPVGAMRGSQGIEYTRRTLAAARALTAELPAEAVPAAFIRTVEGIVALFEGRFVDSFAHLDAAAHAPYSSVIGHSSLRGTIYAMRAMSLYWMGRSGELLQLLPGHLRDLDQIDNLYARLWLELLEAWAHACSGRLAKAWSVSERVRSRLPEGAFELHRWYLDYGQVKFLLLEGKVEEAWQRLEEIRRRTRFMLIGHAQRISARWVRAVAALDRAGAVPSTRTAMLAEARRMVKRIEDERVPWTDAIARCLRASIESFIGSNTEALRLFADAEAALAPHPLEALTALVRRARGHMMGGAEGHMLVTSAEQWMADQGVDVSLVRVLLGDHLS